MRKWLLLALCCFPVLMKAQFLTPPQYMTLAPTLLYFEGYGVGGTYSLNVEQVFAQYEAFAMSTRFGFGVYPSKESDGIDIRTPFMLNLMVGNKDLLGLLGGGIRADFNPDQVQEGLQVQTVGALGIRLHPIKHAGIFLQIAYTPTLREQTVEHGLGFAIGLGFDK